MEEWIDGSMTKRVRRYEGVRCDIDRERQSDELDKGGPGSRQEECDMAVTVATIFEVGKLSIRLDPWL